MAKEKTTNIDSLINDVVSDVAPPSPIADMDVGISDGKPEVSTSIPASNSTEAPAKKKRGRPAGTTVRPKIEGVQNHQSTVTPPVDINNAGIEPCAELCVMLVNTSGMAMGGEAAAMRNEEIMLAKNGFVAYFKQKGVENVPAWVVLTGALAPYYLRVITTTPAKTTVSNFMGRAVLRIKEIWKGRKDARINRRNDIKRKDDSGEASTGSGA